MNALDKYMRRTLRARMSCWQTTGCADPETLDDMARRLSVEFGISEAVIMAVAVSARQPPEPADGDEADAPPKPRRSGKWGQGRLPAKRRSREAVAAEG